MKVETFIPVAYYGAASAVQDWPLPSRLFEPDKGMMSIQRAFEQFEAAHEAGFDWLNMAEHHYSPAQMTPSPQVFAAALGERLPEANIGVLGTLLLLQNPVQVAEQYAALDNMLAGRLKFALLRGTPNEYLTYGSNPWESRARFEEAVEIVLRTFTETEPFAWEGQYYRFRNISLFPGPVQQPHPRVLLSGNSPSSARFAGRMKCDLGLSFVPPHVAAANIAVYREAAAEAGWEPTADNILYRQFCYVAETDEEARADIAELGWPEGSGIYHAAIPEIGQLMGTAAMAAAGLPKGFVPDKPVNLQDFFGPPFVGSPQTVLDGVRAFEAQAGIGRVEFFYHGFINAMSHENVIRSIKLTGQTLIPALHDGADTVA
jgi:alkanesulfonate monooxygenase SsuD/methylene tetrahydromethanopterin reductase-like flavin-dependent oxidoreductase (luciferase family)